MLPRRVCCGASVIAVLVAATASGVAPRPEPVVAAPVPWTEPAPAIAVKARPEVAVPAEVRFPRLGISSSLVHLGLQPDGHVEVPPLRTPGQAGWYALGARPGEVGAAVILGHVNAYRRAGVFLRLAEARPGDEIVVTTEERESLRFVVREVETVAKDRFPSTRVYGPTKRPELRLVTCGGAFDPANGRYLSNVIVYAVLVP
ncbi:class F sortase [Actinokineospora fastidiosa]|uniref:class F sortase n=1 Tax=Actinokineospora fastidiosa TaxID=1816 RepID=UPI001E3ECA96|nr:class F sortase [Actinokineospora fastidiosa]